ncbi:MAG: flagellar basal-body MS-ring/collar protein FliF [Pseudomonadota bacterium]
MEWLKTTWTGLDVRQRIVLAAGTFAMVLMFGLVLRMAGTSEMSLLYANLEPASAGRVMEELDRAGVAYEIRGDAIFVPTAQRDRVRIQLAQDGLPDQGGRGYEILDQLSSFGTTTQMFDAALWRAKEGELARTIGAMQNVGKVRVHLAPGEPRGFSRERVTPTASVTVTRRSGVPLTQEQAMAIRYLVALAVEGLPPAQVAILDSADGVLLRPGDDAVAFGGHSQQRRLSDTIQQRVTDLLSARYGVGKVRVTANVDTNPESETLTERRIDPDSRVAIHTDVEEAEETSADESAAVTVASNLPEGDAGGGGQSNSQRTTTRERTNYEFSEVRREVRREAGQVRKIAIAVLIDAQETIGDDGQTVMTPVSPEELESVEALVKSAIGFDEARGDVVTVRSLEFSTPNVPTPEPVPGLATRLIEQNALALIQLGVLAVMTIVTALFVVRPLLRTQTASPAGALTAENAPALPGGSDTDSPTPLGDDAQLTPIDMQPDPIDELQALVSDRPEEARSVLHRWLRDDPLESREVLS